MVEAHALRTIQCATTGRFESAFEAQVKAAAEQARPSAASPAPDNAREHARNYSAPHLQFLDTTERSASVERFAPLLTAKDMLEH